MKSRTSSSSSEEMTRSIAVIDCEGGYSPNGYPYELTSAIKDGEMYRILCKAVDTAYLLFSKFLGCFLLPLL